MKSSNSDCKQIWAPIYGHKSSLCTPGSRGSGFNPAAAGAESQRLNNRLKGPMAKPEIECKQHWTAQMSNWSSSVSPGVIFHL